MAEDSGNFEQWITDRIDFSTVRPPSGGSGTFEQWITDRLDFEDYAAIVAVSDSISLATLLAALDAGVAAGGAASPLAAQFAASDMGMAAGRAAPSLAMSLAALDAGHAQAVTTELFAARLEVSEAVTAAAGAGINIATVARAVMTAIAYITPAERISTIVTDDRVFVVVGDVRTSVA